MRKPSPRLTFGKALRVVRLTRGIPQDDMEPAASRAYMHLLESGKKSPTLGMIERLASRLEVHPATLVLLASALSPRAHRKGAISKVIAAEFSEFMANRAIADSATPRRPRRKVS